MKLKNNAKRNYIYGEIILKSGEELEIKDEKIAKVLLSQEDVEEVVNKEEVERLKAEVEKLKQEKKTKPQKVKASK